MSNSVNDAAPRSSTDANADAALAKMGYKGELPRNLGMMSVLGLYVASFFLSPSA